MAACPNCGQNNLEGARFCHACAAPLGPGGAAAHEVRKTVTVVFSDIVDSTPLGERLEPESLRRVMSRYFGEMAIPLGPDRRLRFREVDGIDDVATLPAVVRRVLSPRKRRKTGSGMPEPLATDASGVDRQRQGYAAPGCSSPRTTAATRRYSPRARRSIGFSSSSASIGFVIHTGM